jgi:ADP-ribosylglycohydrolase
MNQSEPSGRLVVITEALQTSCFISFAAPYSLSEKTELPVGMRLVLSRHEEREEPYRFAATAVDREAWAPFIVSSQHRFDRNFRGSYEFYLHSDEVDRHCKSAEAVPGELPQPLRLGRAIRGSLFGTAIGDSIGLPYEGLSSKRLQKTGVLPLRHRFLFGRGMLSDDTEHTCIVAHALIYSHENIDEFSSQLAWSLRFWLLGLPAGIGIATLQACLKLWCFRSADTSGVFSAGNGPAMRSALLGVYAFDDRKLRRQLVEISTRITHTDPKALKGALVVAEMAARNTQGQPFTIADCLTGLGDIIGGDEELAALLAVAVDSAREQQTALEYCQQHNQSKGVGGHIYHTLPVVVQIVLRHNDNYELAISEAVCCGGDTDTVAAIVGGIVGANVGKTGIPDDWLENLKDWPRTNRYLALLADELAAVKWRKQPGRTLWMDPIRLWLRNAGFLMCVLAHVLQRLLPRY